MSDYPPYACSCCGVTNGDMFYDYFRSLGREPTERENIEFEVYRKYWMKLKEERKVITANVWGKSRIGRQQTQATRDKISATIRAKGLKEDKEPT